MVTRHLLLALALAGSTAPAFAAVDPAPGGEASVLATPSALPARLRPRPVLLQPPARPADLDGDPAPQPAAAAAASDVGKSAADEAAGSDQSSQAASVQVLPPLRPTLPVEAEPAASEAATAPTEEAAPLGPIVRTLPPQRPALPDDEAPAEVAPGIAAAPAAPAATPSLFAVLFGPKQAPVPAAEADIVTGRPELDAMIAHHAKLNGVPASLVHRVVVRESKYNPRAVGRGGAMGLMQIKTGTARALGYEGGPSGLLNAETNLTYAVKYLAGAYRTARGNHDLAVRHYASGYYYAAKRQGLTRLADRRRAKDAVQEADASAGAEAAAGR